MLEHDATHGHTTHEVSRLHMLCFSTEMHIFWSTEQVLRHRTQEGTVMVAVRVDTGMTLAEVCTINAFLTFGRKQCYLQQ